MEKTELKERPIIMGAESVRAILEERKTQTRRVIDPHKYNIGGWDMPVSKSDIEAGYPVYQDNNGDFHSVVERCPYGNIGDRLWVRESWGVGCRPDPNSGWVDGIEYKADEVYLDDRESLHLRVIDDQDLYKYEKEGWSSPIFMPRWASRITLEITDIRVERLQDITEDDAIEEGVEFGSGWEEECGEGYCTGEGWMDYKSFDYGCSTPKDSYCTLWDSLNAKRGYPWESNPWVWVVTFKVIGREAD
jgi:hypothetical protein